MKGARHVICRPKAHSAGLAAGHLYRDSSVFEFAVRPLDGSTGGGIVCELRLPFAALGELAGGRVGGKFGFSVLLGDNDGEGKVARMRWGGGLSGGKTAEQVVPVAPDRTRKEEDQPSPTPRPKPARCTPRATAPVQPRRIAATSKAMMRGRRLCGLICG